MAYAPLNERDLKIGSGTYGTVYKSDPHNVYKIMDKFMTNTQEPCDVTIRELYTICSLNHPHIVMPHQISVHTKRIIMHMPHGGTPLNDWVSQTPPSVRASHFWCIMSQIVHTCNYLKEYGIQQIDMRPNNILIEMKDDVPYVTLIDFGLVSFKHPHTSTWSNAFGCWIYCPPEVLSDTPRITETSSIWEIAMVGCYLLLHENLFQESIGDHVNVSSFKKCKSHMVKKSKNSCWPSWELTPTQIATMHHVLDDTWYKWYDLFNRMTTWNPDSRITFEELAAYELLNYETHMQKPPTTIHIGKNFVDYPKLYDKVIDHSRDAFVMIHTWMENQCSDLWLSHAKNLNDRFIQACFEQETCLTVRDAMNAALACIITVNYVYDSHVEDLVKHWITQTKMKQSVDIITKWIWYIGSMCYWQLL